MNRSRKGVVAAVLALSMTAAGMSMTGGIAAAAEPSTQTRMRDYADAGGAGQLTAAETCWNGSRGDIVKIEKNNWFDADLEYGARWRWCAVNGTVTKFIVDLTWPAPGTTPAYVDIQPVNPGRFGESSYPIYIRATAGSRYTYDEIALMGDGQMLVACRPGTVRYHGECYGEEYLNGEKSLWGGKTTVECADEATRKAVKKILDEQNAADAARQGSKQLGKKLLAVPGIFKCVLWDS